MLKLQGLTAVPDQSFFTSIPSGKISLRLKYRPAVQMFFLDIEYQNFKSYGIKLVKNLNILDAFKKILPFGIYIETESNNDPFLINDFSSEKFSLNILDESEKNQINDFYKGG